MPRIHVGSGTPRAQSIQRTICCCLFLPYLSVCAAARDHLRKCVAEIDQSETEIESEEMREGPLTHQVHPSLTERGEGGGPNERMTPLVTAPLRTTATRAHTRRSDL